ncbi:MAG: hypothetical protein J0M20_04795 [Burkholderiales bacterium]|nr:hypothetical protein [Burkholderiales bacterium]
MKFLFHIGAGKTGTSSIQQTLRTQREVLERHGVWYLGLMLEHAPVQLFPWQKASASEVFHQLEPLEGQEQLHAVLTATVEKARQAGIHTIIWSNESFFDRNQKTRQPLADLLAEGVDVRFIAYVRRYDAWVRSAYVQWGIKHKTYPGPVIPFRDWIRRRPPGFAAALLSIQDRFPDRVVVRNVDAAGDAVSDFLQVSGIDQLGLSKLRENVSPPAEELLLRALFNTRIREKVLPMRFDKVVGAGLDFEHTPLEHLQQLMPNAEDMAHALDTAASDRRQLDSLLKAQGQPAMVTEPLPERAMEVRAERLVLALSQIVCQQALRLERLEQQLAELTAGAGKDEARQ